MRQEVERWLDGMSGQVLTAALRAGDRFRPRRAKRINDRQFAFRGADTYVGVGFSKPPRQDSTLADLQDTFKYVALDKVPVPGIRSSGWEILLRTPRSAVTEGVTIESWEDGVLRIRVRTEFHAIWGRRTDMVLPEDAGMPEGTFFNVRSPVKADLVIDGRLLRADMTGASFLEILIQWIGDELS